MRGGLEPKSHLLGDGHEQVVEDFQDNGVGAGADRSGVLGGGDAAQHKVAERVYGGRPAWLDNGCGVGLCDDRRAVDDVTGPYFIPLVEICVGPGPVDIYADGVCLTTLSGARRPSGWSVVVGVSLTGGLYRHRFHDNLPVAHQERKTS